MTQLLLKGQGVKEHSGGVKAGAGDGGEKPRFGFLDSEHRFRLPGEAASPEPWV